MWIGAAIVGLVVLLSVTAVAYPVAYLRLVESDQRSSEGRGFMNEQALLIATGKPVFGVGLGGYHRAAKSIKPVSFASADQRLREALVNFLGIVHNKYLLVFAEHGAVGLVLLFLLLWKSIRLFFRVPVWNNRVQELVGLGLAGALVTQAVFYLFDHFYLEVGLMLFWVFAAGLAALGRMQGPGPAMKTGVA